MRLDLMVFLEVLFEDEFNSEESLGLIILIF